ncbi:TPA: modulator protein [Citrobacter freundii]|nr:modulator protein [Citrobacter freundii]HCD1278535.1 DUF5431 family protein [Citrobacter amalonaticus]
MSQQHQYGLLPCSMQGGVIHETAAKRPYLVRIMSSEYMVASPSSKTGASPPTTGASR